MACWKRQAFCDCQNRVGGWRWEGRCGHSPEARRLSTARNKEYEAKTGGRETSVELTTPCLPFLCIYEVLGCKRYSCSWRGSSPGPAMVAPNKTFIASHHLY